MNVVVCDSVVKRFRAGKRIFDALSGVDFSLRRGEIAGLFGPDGSGKSTLLRILAGLMRADGGSAAVLGFDVVRETAKMQSAIGFMPQSQGLYETLTVRENLRLYADLRGVPEKAGSARIGELLEMTDLARFPNRLAGRLSGGMKSKLALACALVSEPDLLLLDEPTVGVDALSRRELWELFRRIADKRNTTALIASSYMDEAAFCDRALVLFEGRLVASGTPDELREIARKDVANPTCEQGFLKLIAGRIPPPLKRRAPPDPNAPVMASARDLVRKFGSFVAVDHVSFQVRKGEIFGLLGANGAGKTTTFRMLCGLDAPASGEVEIGGSDLRKAPGTARMKLGYVAQKFSLYGDLSVKENLEFFGGACGLRGERLKSRIAWAMKEFALDARRDLPAALLPLGVKRRLSVACALLHEPEILFLDEATSGADPIARRDFWERITDLADRGAAVVVTTHFLDEAEHCDRIAVMQDGRVVAVGTVEEIRRIGAPEGDAESVTLEDAFVNIIRRVRKERETEACP